VLDLELLTLYNIVNPLEPGTPKKTPEQKKKEAQKQLEQVKNDFREFDKLAQKAIQKNRAKDGIT